MAVAIAGHSVILRHEAVDASIAAVILLPSEPVSHGVAGCITEKVRQKTAEPVEEGRFRGTPIVGSQPCFDAGRTRWDRQSTVCCVARVRRSREATTLVAARASSV